MTELLVELWTLDHEPAKVGKAGADFGTQPASSGPKANLASPTTVGECASQEPALAPSRDVVPGPGYRRVG